MKLLPALCLVASCGHADPKPEPSNPMDQVSQTYEQAADRLVSMLDDGWVVSRNGEGGPEHTGDSLIWTGIALGSLDCARGAAVEQALLGMIQETGGKVYRHPTLKSQATMDGALGLYNGLSQRIKRCPGSQYAWSVVVGQNPGFLENPINLEAGADLPREFTYVRDLLAFRLGYGEEPGLNRKGALEAQIAAWTGLVNANHSACYRVHLGLIALQTVEHLGVAVSQTGRDSFCAASRGMDMPTVDLYCGRPTGFLAAFQYDAWENRLQRCGAWETPDGKGLKTPALDLITFIRNAYNLPEAP